MSRELFSSLVKRVDSLSIVDVIARDVKLKKKGNEYLGLCPFHNDRHLGSFMVSPAKNIWKCFVCGEGGPTGTSFYAQRHGMTVSEAVIDLGRIYNLISLDELADYEKRFEKKTKRDIVIGSTPKFYSGNSKLPPRKLDLMYRAFIKAAGEMPEEYAKNLIFERKLEDKDLKNFFVFPEDNQTFWDRFNEQIKAAGLTIKDLEHTPGFFFTRRSGTYSFGKYAGALGIISHDINGLVNGIEIRRNTKEKKNRYVAFSSGFADRSCAWASKGTNSGSVVDVLPSSKTSYIVCTEGKFKALQFEKMGLFTLNMRGVTTWPIDDVVAIANSIRCRKLLLCYDADIGENDAVAKAAKQFALAAIKAGLEVQFVVWDLKYGKGIDDMIKAGHFSQLSRLPADEFISLFLDPLIQSTEKNLRKVS